jgi:aspartate kinase
VCSARSSHTKALGTTNLLLQASKEALAPISRNGAGASGSATPYFPKRVGSGFFDGRERDRDQSPAAKELQMNGSLMSSISSLRELDLRAGSGASSPSPFQSTGRRSGSPTSPIDEKAPGATSEGFHDTVDTIKRGHLEAARKAIREGPVRDELEDEIERDCETLRGFLHAAQVGP